VPVILLIDDDCTMEKLSRDTVKEFVRIRHLAYERTGIETGLIVGVIGVHRFHASDLILRTKFHGIVVRDCPSNKYDYDFLKNYFEEETLNAISEIEEYRRQDDQYYGWAIFRSSNWEGIIVSDKPSKDELIDLWVELRSSENKTIHVSNGEWIPKPIDSWEDPEFLDEVINEIHLKKTKLEHIDRDREIFKRFVNGEKPIEIASDYGLTPTRIRQIIRQIQQCAQGYAAEKAYHKRHPTWEYGGGNTSKPDFIDHENRRVISFKAYADPEITPSTTWPARRIGQAEKQYAKQNGYALEMHIYELTKQIFIILKMERKTKEEEMKIQEPSSRPHFSAAASLAETASAKPEKAAGSGRGGVVSARGGVGCG